MAVLAECLFCERIKGTELVVGLEYSGKEEFSLCQSEVIGQPGGVLLC